MQNVFAELKSDQKKELQHVEKDKSPKKSTVEARSKKETMPLSDEYGPPKPAKAVKPPMFELVANRDWTIENQFNNKEVLKVNNASMNQNVCLRDCDGVTAQVESKINCASIDRCKNTNLILSDLISTIELIHCARVKVQVTGKASSMSIDNCDGVTIYLSNESKCMSFTTSKCGEINICFPSDADPDDFLELPIPFQFVSRIVGDKIVTTVSENYSC